MYFTEFSFNIIARKGHGWGICGRYGVSADNIRDCFDRCMIAKGGDFVPKCPVCNGEMKTKKTEKDPIFVCDKDGAFIPKSIFGIT